MSIKVPKYSLFKPASELSSLIKKRTKSKDTYAEMILRRYVWKLGLRYRIHVKNLPGKPDLVFPSARIVIFCDGDFWHGRDWKKLRRELKHRKNTGYWIPKIKSNIERDISQTKELKCLGWHVIRFWEKDILLNPEFFALKIYRIIKKQSYQ